MTRRIPNVLSIAGSDPSGGAGVQADLKTFAALGCHGMAAIAALTAQNTRGVAAIHVPPADFVGAQIDAIFIDIPVDAIKIGMLGAPAVVDIVAERLTHWGARNIVLDPVLASTSGESLGGDEVAAALLARLAPLARVVTPNLPEIARLTGLPEPRNIEEMRRAGERLLAEGAQAALVKGGHLDSDEAIDLLVTPQGAQQFATPRVATRNSHGTGCTLSSGIAAYLAQGAPLAEAVAAAKTFLTGALRGANRLKVGHGPGPVHHFHALWREE